MDRFNFMSSQKIPHRKGDWCKYSDVEQLEKELAMEKECSDKNACEANDLIHEQEATIKAQADEIDVLEEQLKNYNLHHREIQASGIRFMLENTRCQAPAMRVVQDMLDYADNMEKE